MMNPLLGLVAFLLAQAFLVHGQQYEGEAIPNSLPTTPGSTITYFNIKDANGQNTSFINYFSRPLSTGQQQDPSKVQRAIIMIHGQNRDPATYFASTWVVIGDVAKINSEVTEETVAILAPYFPNEEDENVGYPWSDDDGSTSKALVWSGDFWAEGRRNIYPEGQRSVSSYDVLDQILQYFDDKSVYPNLKQIIVGGHSMGGLTVQRYAAVGKDLGLSSPVRYWVANPNSYLFFNATRPESTADCPTFNDWKEGLGNYTNEYQRDFVQQGRDNGAVFSQYTSRDIAYARGLNDHGDTSTDCRPFTTGEDRGVRFLNFVAGFPPDSGDTIDYVEDVGHSAPEMIADESGLYRLFIDNWSGNGSRHGDFGPRQENGDDPHPSNT